MVLDSFLSVNQKFLEKVQKKLIKCESQPLVVVHGFDFVLGQMSPNVSMESNAQSKIMIGFFFGEIQDDIVDLIAQRHCQQLFTAIVCDNSVCDSVHCDYRFLVNSQNLFDFELCAFAAAKIIF
jgi:hypothetical protein